MGLNSKTIPQSIQGIEKRVLLLGANESETAALCQELADAGVDTAGCASADQLCACLHEGAGAAVIDEESLSAAALNPLTTAWANQPEWSYFPLVVLIQHGWGALAWKHVRDANGAAHAIVLERPVDAATLRNAVHSALRLRDRQYRVRDELTERRNVEQALRASEQTARTRLEEIEAIYRTAPVALCVLDTELRWLRVNERMADITGVEPPDHIGRRMQDVVPKLAAEAKPVLLEVLRTGAPKLSVQVSIQTCAQPGVCRIWSCNWLPLDDEDGNVIGVSGVLEEITEQVQSERVVRESEERLRLLNDTLENRVAERTAKLGRQRAQLRRLAHELTEAEQRERKKLAQNLHDGLQQMLVAIKMRMPLRSADVTDAELAKLSELLDATINAARSLSYDLSPRILHDSDLPEALEWLARWFGEHHSFQVKLAGMDLFPPVPENTKVFLFHAVRELLLNSVKHSGTTQAMVALRDAGPRQALVEVSDQGRGFDPDFVEEDMDTPGFGLFSIQERLKALGGTVHIYSAIGEGARFVLKIPVVAEVETIGRQPISAVPCPTVRTDCSTAQRGAIRILVTDDHRIVREGLVTMLSRQDGFEVVGEADNGVQAIERARELRPDVVVMDVNMPKMNGIDATREIKQHYPDVRVIGLSLHEEEDKAEAMRRAGASLYLRKDGAAERLFEAIRSVSGGPESFAG